MSGTSRSTLCPCCDEEPLERARIEVLAKPEAELMMNLEEGIDDRQFRAQPVLVFGQR
jgi:hypothetical protein